MVISLKAKNIGNITVSINRWLLTHIKGIEMVFPSVPVQKNGTDCGAYLIIQAQKLLTTPKVVSLISGYNNSLNKSTA